MGPPSYMRSVVDRNVVMRHMTLHLRWIFTYCFNTKFCDFWSRVVDVMLTGFLCVVVRILCWFVIWFLFFGIHISSNKILLQMYIKWNLTPSAMPRERRPSAGISPNSQQHTIIRKSGHATLSLHFAVQEENGLLAPSSHAHLLPTSINFIYFNLP